MPFYNAVRRAGVAIERTPIVLPVQVDGHVLACRVFRSRLLNSDVPVYLVEHQPFFERDDPSQGRGLYQQAMGGGYKSDYPDNAGTIHLSSPAAVLELVPHLGFNPDVIHANDWQTGLVPVFLAETYRERPVISTSGRSSPSTTSPIRECSAAMS